VDPAIPRPLAAEAQLPLTLGDPQLDTPAVLVDLDVVESNLRAMADTAARAGLRLRPHVKTHKSLAMAARQLQRGAKGLCVATATEAEVFAQSDADDILLAYPLVGVRKLARVSPLLRTGRLTLVTDSAEVTQGYKELGEHLEIQVPVLLEIDTGMNRSGCRPREAVKLAADIATDPHLRLRGIMTHAGHAHDCPELAGIERVARAEAAIMGAAREDLEAAGLPVEIVSAGSTITAPYLHSSDGITEIRPGTYIYADLRTRARWACDPESIAATCLATVVSHNDRRLTIDAGNKTLTLTTDGQFGLGHLLGRPDVHVERLSEEHGVLVQQAPDPALRVGGRVRILPIHVCAWMDLQAEVYGVRGDQVVERIAVDAMRHSL
jgi:D-serine deaminase-like pyridoxal phosphate-dependent protein